jgi:predicted P-loop ATPase
MEQERFNEHFKKMIVRTVACALGKNFNKQAFIFMGKQSNGKTTFCRWLCPHTLQNYYTENMGTDKDAHITLCENFIINLDELANFHKTEINSFKSMLSKHAVKIRHPYERKASKKLRRASFVGSTNRDEFLTDETGSVRWLCFTVENFDFKYKDDIDINEVWSQGYQLFLKGFDYQLTQAEIEENEKINSSHQVNTIELELLQKYFLPAKKGEPKSYPATATEIILMLRNQIGIKENLTPASIGKALALLGFEKISQRIEGVKHPRKMYYVKHVTQ